MPANDSTIILTDEFKEALHRLERKDFIQPLLFITGRAGTGKSTLLHYFATTTAQNVVVLAPTGLAAINVHGQTIHSFFRLTPRNLLDTAYLKSVARRIPKKELHAFDTLVIDEASMLRADLLDAMDFILRTATRDERPFGGKRVVLFGDLFQLPPVEESADNELFDLFTAQYPTPYFFSAQVLRQMPLEIFELTRIFRQNTDRTFVHLLNRIRDGEVTQSELDTLLNVRRTDQSPEDFENCIILAPTNREVTRRNLHYLSQLDGQEFIYKADIDEGFKHRQILAEPELHLKKGAKIIMLTNQTDCWVNGDIGTVYNLGEDFIQVELKGVVYPVEKHRWEDVRYVFNPLTQKLEPQSQGFFTQYPLKLAWAITIHKSQGLTFEQIFLDIGRGAFASGQTYVALSRCRTLQGVHLKRHITMQDILCDKRVRRFFNEIACSSRAK